jgi:lysyl-tRNA synthetase class 2
MKLDESSDLIKERYKKLEGLTALGVSPFGGFFAKQSPVQTLLDTFEENKKVVTAGRLSAMRFMGKSAFADLKDESGRIQLYLKKDHLSELDGKIFDLLDLGDIIGVEGELFKTKTGEISVRVNKLTLLAKTLRPMPEKWHGLKDVELRYRQRYLDLISNDATKDIFKNRSLIIRAIRRWLDDSGYLEVETPMMHPIPGGAAGKPFKTRHEALGLDLFLRVAPELYLKRLLVGGFDKVYEINKSFRNEGISTRHNPEFTMLEVYTAYDDVNKVMELCETLIRQTAKDVFKTEVLTHENTTLDLRKFERVSFANLMESTFGILPDEPMERWVEKLKKRNVKIEGKDLSRTQLINLVADLLEPAKLSSASDGAVTHRPIFVTDYFAELSPLARRNPKNPHLSERFELYVGGMELANGYSEQNDPMEQRKRFEEELLDKGKEATSQNVDEDYVNALEHGMPPAGGLGIGIDRLVMLLTHQPSIREVILFPQMKNDRR